MNEEVVIIGAGGTGRGFLARLLQEDGARLCFLDRDGELISRLIASGSYCIKVGENRDSYIVENYTAFLIDDSAAIEQAAKSDYIFVSVGAENLPQLCRFFSRLAGVKPAESIKIIVCENGTEPKEILQRALAGTKAEGACISQGVVFCTSIAENPKELTILSENVDCVPYEICDSSFYLPFSHFKATEAFGLLMKRKIYTYNCLSACIAYLGYYKGYTVYAEAANDLQIAAYCEILRKKLDQVICTTMDITAAEQENFSLQAMRKFSSYAISDTVSKNARSAIRKITSNERLMGPVKLFGQAGEDTSLLEILIAAALMYLENEESMEYGDEVYKDPVELFCRVNNILPTEGMVERIRGYLALLRSGRDLSELFNTQDNGKLYECKRGMKK